MSEQLTLTVRTLMKNLLLKSHVTVHLHLLARSITIIKNGLSGLCILKIYKVLTVNTGQRQATKLEEHGLLNHFIIGKKAVAKMKEQSESESHPNTS